jgi:DNA-directed RNA polymerase specialized sigma24 family protein
MALAGACELALSSVESSGSAIDLSALVEAYAPLLFRVAHSVLRSQADAEDVVQDAFIAPAGDPQLESQEHNPAQRRQTGHAGFAR